MPKITNNVAAVGGLLILILIIVGFTHTPGQSVAEYREKAIAVINHDLASSDNGIRKRIEDAHLTVTSKSASVTSFNVLTVDGTDNAGRHGSNVAEVDVIITVIWDGWIQKNGYTEFEVDYDTQNRVVKQTRYLRSSALINMETIDWTSVGFTVGTYLAEASM